ncbi:hypothetical protein [Ferruginibacter sp.]|nr:hypothetical protein [Ferruginibacter sp.]
MKKLVGVIIMMVMAVSLQAQQEETETKTKGFKKENLFTGGSITASFYSGGTVLGISPCFGYSINKIIDAGVLVNFTYTGQRDYSGDKYRQLVYGPGVFARIYPVNMLFVQGTFEHNFTSITYKPAYNGPIEKYKVDANSLLVGAGYCSGREGVGTMFYYLSIMFDVTKDINSPYVEQLQDGSLRAQPIIKAGLQVPLFQGRNNRRRF